MKRLFKTVVQASIATVAPALWRLRDSSLLILMYHRVLPETSPLRINEQPGMYVSPDSLAMQLRLLKDSFVLVHLDDWLDRKHRGESLPRRACAITFDDGWRDNYDHAFPILRGLSVPATIYLVSDLVGTRYSFWPNAIADLLVGGNRDRWPMWLAKAVAVETGTDLRTAVITSGLVDRVIMQLKNSYSDGEMRDLTEEFITDGTGERNLLSWDEARSMARDDLIRFGSHTRRHTRLIPGIDRDVMQDEIVDSARVIQEQIGVRPRTFCYPNGDYVAAAVELVRGAYSGAVTTRRGWNHSSTTRIHELLRIGMHEDVSSRRTAFLARICGVG